MDRKTFIGGSDISAVMGLSRWKTPLQLWSEKTGKIAEPDLSDNEFVEMGNELEETVARVFTKRTGKKVRKAPKVYVSKQYVYMACQVDRLVEGTDELLECKTCSAWKEKEWEADEIPSEYILQVMWQLGITGKSIGWIAVIIGGNKFVYKEIKFDKELFDTMVEQAKVFWAMVQDNIAPMAIGGDNEFIVQLHPEDKRPDLVEDEKYNSIVSDLQAVKESIKSQEEKKDALEAKLKQRIADNMGLLTSEYKITWKTQTSRRVDTQAIKDAGLYDKFSKESASRVLRIGKP